jgi:hypothetical protein
MTTAYIAFNVPPESGDVSYVAWTMPVIDSVDYAPYELSAPQDILLSVGVDVAMNLGHSSVAGTAPINFSFVGLPAGLEADNDGLITGTPTTSGAFQATRTATNDYGVLQSVINFIVAVPVPEVGEPNTLKTLPVSYRHPSARTMQADAERREVNA